jgi:hypothetical protein
LNIWYSLATLVQEAVAVWALAGLTATDSNTAQAAIRLPCGARENFREGVWK